jgi:RNA methyltransferase, TrmH family
MRHQKRQPASEPRQHSPDTAIVKELRQLRSRDERERTGTFYIEGVHIVAQAVRLGATIERCVVAPDLLTSGYGKELAGQLRAADVPITELSAAAFGSISFKENLQGLGAVVRPRAETLEDVRMLPAEMWVALHGVGNPGNLGAILRTCDAVGCTGLIMLGDTTDPFHPAAVRASMGALFAQRLARASWEEFVDWKQRHGHPVVGTSGGADLEYRAVDYPLPFVLLMGSERLGLSPAQQAACDLLVRIPMIGAGDSLNLGVATSIVLYEAFHQHRDAMQARDRPGVPST